MKRDLSFVPPSEAGNGVAGQRRDDVAAPPAKVDGAGSTGSTGERGTVERGTGAQSDDENVILFPQVPCWLTYSQAAEYTGWSVRYLRNLVSADAIPVYGPPRSRRFRPDMLDLFVTNRDAAMRKYRLERLAHHGD